MAESRQEFIDECRAEAERFRKEWRPWVMTVRDNRGSALNKNERARQLAGIGFMRGRGRPIGTAFIILYKDPNGHDRAMLGASVLHPRDQYNKHIGVHYAIKNAHTFDLEPFLSHMTRGKPAAILRRFPRRARPTLLRMIESTMQQLKKKKAELEAENRLPEPAQ